MDDGPHRHVKLLDAARSWHISKEGGRKRARKFVATGDVRLIRPYKSVYQDAKGMWWFVRDDLSERETVPESPAIHVVLAQVIQLLLQELQAARQERAEYRATIERLTASISPATMGDDLAQALMNLEQQVNEMKLQLHEIKGVQDQVGNFLRALSRATQHIDSLDGEAPAEHSQRVL